MFAEGGSSISFLRGSIDGNRATSGFGGGLVLLSAPTTITRTSVLSNNAGSNGGGAYLETSNLTVSLSDFFLNNPNDVYHWGDGGYTAGYNISFTCTAARCI